MLTGPTCCSMQLSALFQINSLPHVDNAARNRADNAVDYALPIIQAKLLNNVSCYINAFPRRLFFAGHQIQGQ